MELNIDDEWVLDYEKVEKMAFQYYNTVYDNESNMALQDILNKIQHLNIPALNERQSQRLLELISMSEVEDAIFNIKAFKSPGLDGVQGGKHHIGIFNQPPECKLSLMSSKKDTELSTSEIHITIISSMQIGHWIHQIQMKCMCFMKFRYQNNHRKDNQNDDQEHSQGTVQSDLMDVDQADIEDQKIASQPMNKEHVDGIDHEKNIGSASQSLFEAHVASDKSISLDPVDDDVGLSDALNAPNFLPSNQHIISDTRKDLVANSNLDSGEVRHAMNDTSNLLMNLSQIGDAANNTFVEDGYMIEDNEWTRLHATSKLGLALVGKTAEGDEDFVWDIFCCRLGLYPKFKWFLYTLFYFPSINGPFVCNPFNWYFRLNFWAYELESSLLRNQLTFRPPSIWIKTEKKLAITLKRKRIEEICNREFEAWKQTWQRKGSHAEKVECGTANFFSWGNPSAPLSDGKHLLQNKNNRIYQTKDAGNKNRPKFLKLDFFNLSAPVLIALIREHDLVILNGSGGMIVAWNERINISVMDVSHHLIHLKGKDIKADKDSNVKLRNLLDEYFELAGQKINRNKSLFVFSPNTHVDLKEKYKGDWGIEYRNDLRKYLGTFVDGRLNSHNIFEELLEKIQSRLAGRKSKLISQARRATLINYVLQALPI
ncbi:putative RNA-directed DNA polymerase [Senna tora]|uniref:Putative RNA-directed DNA polymerase n=1 Tax=Senna tora TaxID=362788 RepID=A0A834U4P1_9FABA|nr:putative RNA-directed DNA polymerase [Senna tora]